MSEAERLIRQRLDQANGRLAEIEKERQLWLAIRDGDQKLLEQISGEKHGPALVLSKMPAAATLPPSSVVKCAKWPGAIREILQAAHGAVLTTEEIYKIAQEAGLKSESRKPLGQVDWNIAKMIREKTAPIERVRTQHYRWTIA